MSITVASLNLALARLLDSKVIYKGMDAEMYVPWTVMESSSPGTYSRPWQSSDASARTLTEEWQRSVRDRMGSQSFAERLPLP